MQVGVDGVLYLKVLNPERASYGITDYIFAITQLAQTTLRSEVGKIDLDRTFEERTNINTQVVTELDKASEPWGVKVLRYEIKNITPPQDILAAMEKQMRAEREKRAVILTSEGAARRRDQHRRRREAAGHQGVGSAQAAADQRGRRAGRGDPRGRDRDRRRHPPRRRGDHSCRAASRRCSCASPSSTSRSSASSPRTSNTLVLPANVADVGSMIALAMKVVGRQPGA